jgi:integrase
MAGWIEQKGKTFYAVVDHGHDPVTGKRRRSWHKSGTTKRDAQRLLQRLLDDAEDNTFIEPDRINLADYLTRDWLPTIRNEVRPSTFDSYRRSVEIHVIPHLGAARLQSLRPIDLTRYYTMLLESGRRDGRGGLSPKTVRNIHLMLRKALDDAVSLLFLRTNPAVGAKPPRVSAVKHQTIRYWTPTELRTFLDANKDHHHWALWYLGATTGMRRGELLGLRWRDVDLAARRLSVRHTIVSVGYKITHSDPKTSRGERTIDLDDRTVEVLLQHRTDQEAARIQVGEGYDDQDLVFAKPSGAPLQPDLVTQAFERRLVRTDVPRIRFHDLRHTHATLMLQAGVPPKVVSERLGHATVAFTMDVYAHVIPGMQAEAARAFAELID